MEEARERSTVDWIRKKSAAFSALPFFLSSIHFFHHLRRNQVCDDDKEKLI